METITLGKFQIVVNRLMTLDEVREKCAEMGLGTKVTKFIVKEFSRAYDIEDAPWNSDGSCTIEDVTGDDGRIALGQSWDDVYEQLRELLGNDEELTENIFNTFFQE